MTHRKTRWLGATITAAAVAVSTVGTAQAADKSITIGWTSWADAQFVVQLVKQQIESHTSIKVNAQKTTIGVQYRAVANGDIDAMIMAWLPDTHKDYWKSVHNDVVDLGPLYTGAVVGWVVPDHVSDKIKSMSDLKDKQNVKLFHGSIQGIDPGAGEMHQSEKALQDYDLKSTYNLKSGNEEKMTDALARAIQESKPIVVTLWTPHWAFGKWNLRFLKDPKHVFGGSQHVDAVVRKNFRKDYPQVAKFLSNVHIPLDELQDAMYVAHQTDEKTAVSNFVKKHQALVKSWWIGTGVKGSGGADADTAEHS